MYSIFHFKKHKKPSETGRSMVEILGVLAVLGVLAIGGIYGYKWSMDKHRANDIVSEVNTRATDIWHVYQGEEKFLPNSPDEDAFPEYGELTQTSFPIMVTTHPDANAFKTWVDNVPSDVCKKVLNENLEDAITGLQFVHVENVNEDGTGSGLVRFRGDDTICGERNTLNQMVFTSFLDEGGGAVAPPSDPDNPNKELERCSEDYDCDETCCDGYCDLDTLTCKDRCYTSDKVCNKNICECVECMQDSDCPSAGQICDPAANACVSVPEHCGEGERFGKEYRAKNGACVPCSYISEVLIMNSDDNNGIFETEVAGNVIKDTRSGIDMCSACKDPKHRIEGSGNGASQQTYCATGCIIGNSFLSKSKGCIRCDSTTEIEIADEDQARSQCLACPNRIWWKSGNTYKCVLKNCPNGHFKNNGVCRKCKLNPSVDCYSGSWPACFDFHASVVWNNGWTTSSGSMKSSWEAECNSCGSASDPDLREDHYVVTVNSNHFCPRKCPISDGTHFQNMYGTCYDCTTDETPGLVLNGSMNDYVKNSCLNCKTAAREVVNNKCVKVNNDACKEGQVKGADYKCYECDHPSGIPIVSDEVSGCTKNCGETRFVDEEAKYCSPICAENQFMDSSGTCLDCSKIGNSYNIGSGDLSTDIQNYCRKGCGEGVNKYQRCDVYAYCLPENCGENRLHCSRYCSCCACPTTYTEFTTQSECEACGNHIYIGGDYRYCAKYNPGVSGVCNNDSPDTTKFPNYPEGEGVYYRDVTGMCRLCQDSTTAYEATEEECNSCGGIRRLANKQCVYGGCTDGVSFVTSTGCKACDTTTAKVKTINSSEAKHLCTQCGRRIMTVHLSEETYESFCVQQCTPDEWQDVNGECHTGIMDTVDGKNEIGSDDISINKCHSAGRQAEQEGYQYFCMPK